jgi:hypothetical protein
MIFSLEILISLLILGTLTSPFSAHLHSQIIHNATHGIHPLNTTVDAPQTNASMIFDYEKLKELVRVAVRFLDNCHEVEFERECEEKRRIDVRKE